MNNRQPRLHKQKYENSSSSVSLCFGLMRGKVSAKRKKHQSLNKSNKEQILKIRQPLFSTYEKIIYRSPHEQQQRIEVEKIFIEEPHQLEQALKTDQQFLKRCACGNYSIRKKLESLPLFKAEANLQQIAKFIENLSANVLYQNQQPKIKKITGQFPLKRSNNQTITIRSDFEGGSQFQTLKISELEYFLILKNDTNTQNFTQWFHFFLQASLQSENSTESTNKIFKFVIINVKKAIKFEQGMKLLTRKNGRIDKKHYIWKRNLPFVIFQADLNYENNRNYFAVAFSLELNQIKNGLFVSFNYPYPVSRLQVLAQKVIVNETEFNVVQIGKSTLGNPILMFKSETNPKKNVQNRNVVILCRQHASQISSSFISEFIIKRLSYFTNSSYLTNINWYIIPLANPDGVIHGNSRTNIKGYDINRCWSLYLNHFSIQVQTIASFLHTIQLGPNSLIIDLHSHSRAYGVFTYSNQYNQFVRIFEQKMKEICPYFDVSKCRVGHDSTKRNTFRVQVQNRFKVKNVITIQTSFYGYICSKTGKLKDFVMSDYDKIAGFILQSIQNFIKYENQNKQDGNIVSSIPLNQIESKDQISIDSSSQSNSDEQIDYLENIQFNKAQKLQSKLTFSFKAKNTFHSSCAFKQQASNKMNKSLDFNNLSIVNLYQASDTLLDNKQSKSTRSKQRRVTSAYQRYNTKNSQTARIKQKEVIILDEKEKNYKEKNQMKFEEQENSNVNRKSFRRLFACAQMRYSYDTEQFIKKIALEKEEQRKSTNISRSLQQKQKPKQHIKNLSPPICVQTTTQQYKQLRQIQSALLKRSGAKNVKSFYFTKKQKVQSNKDKTNQKIALLCQYVKKISHKQFNC